jgi:hypothetical protein
MIGMTMKIYDGNETYIEVEDPNTWWLTAFKLRREGIDKNAVTLESSLTFRNEEMCLAFTEAANAIPGNTCTANGCTAHIIWK